MAWTDEMIDTLKKLWDQGVSTGEIGKRLGVTKNSVVGKVHRLGLDGRPSPIKRKTDVNTSGAEQKTKEVKKEKEPAKKTLPKTETQKTKIVKEEKTIEIPAAKTKRIEHFIEDVKLVEIKETEPTVYKEGAASLTDLGINSCRWPIGDPKDENFHFCGKKTRAGQTYCDEHSQIAYVKIVKK